MNKEKILTYKESNEITGTITEIPDGYTKIADNAFASKRSMENIEELIIPKSLSDINLKNINFYLHLLRKITVHADNLVYTDINGVLFSKDRTELIYFPPHHPMHNYIVPDTVRCIGNMAFAISGRSTVYDNDIADGVLSVELPNGLQEIGDNAFYSCKCLTDIIIPDSVYRIGEAAFSACKRLERIIIPDRVCEIGEDVFRYCESLRSVVLGKRVPYIPRGAFVCCDNLEELVIGDAVSEIRDYALSGCGKLQKLIIPAKVDYIAYSLSSMINASTFILYPSCNFTEISVDENNNSYTDIDGVMFSKDKTKLLAYPGGRQQSEYTVPQGVTEIGKKAFYNCSNLTEIVLPDGLKIIGNNAFYHCDKLISINLPDTLEEIGKGVFSRCESIDNIIIPHKISHVSYEMFSSCDRLKTITLPKNLKSIGADAFRYCESLEEITIPDSVEWVQDKAFKFSSALKQVKFKGKVYSYDEEFKGVPMDFYDDTNNNTARKKTQVVISVIQGGIDGVVEHKYIIADANNYYEALCTGFNETMLVLAKNAAEETKISIAIDHMYADSYFEGPFTFDNSNEMFTNIEATSHNMYEAFGKAFRIALEKTQHCTGTHLPSFGRKQNSCIKGEENGRI